MRQSGDESCSVLTILTKQGGMMDVLAARTCFCFLLCQHIFLLIVAIMCRLPCRMGSPLSTESSATGEVRKKELISLNLPNWFLIFGGLSASLFIYPNFSCPDPRGKENRLSVLSYENREVNTEDTNYWPLCNPAECFLCLFILYLITNK